MKVPTILEGKSEISYFKINSGRTWTCLLGAQLNHKNKTIQEMSTSYPSSTSFYPSEGRKRLPLSKLVTPML
jgi:hypothetical protein